MASKKLIVGNKVRCTTICEEDEYVVRVGDILTISNVYYEHPCQNFNAEGYESAIFPTQSFENYSVKAFEVGDTVCCLKNYLSIINNYHGFEIFTVRFS